MIFTPTKSVTYGPGPQAWGLRFERPLMASLLREYDSRPGSDAALIGVVARPEDHAVVREFFELFKVPWELYRAGAHYDVVLQADGVSLPSSARLVVVYGGS